MRMKRLITRVILAAALAAAWGTAAMAQTAISRAAGAFGVGSGPEGVVSDGTNVWIRVLLWSLFTSPGARHDWEAGALFL